MGLPYEQVRDLSIRARPPSAATQASLEGRPRNGSGNKLLFLPKCSVKVLEYPFQKQNVQ